MTRYVRHRRRYSGIPSGRRLKVVLRDHQTCRYCGRVLDPFAPEGHEDFLTIDHVKPRREGGTSCQENLVVACRECNHKKGAYSLWRAKMRLLPVTGSKMEKVA